MIAEAIESHEAERKELEWLLSSGALGRSGNVARVLRYICEETFAGRGADIKEYSIAVDALGRRADFDPHTDTIVRVTIYTLRKRLSELYDNAESRRAFQIVIPSGHYTPSFVPKLYDTETPAAIDQTTQMDPDQPEPAERLQDRPLALDSVQPIPSKRSSGLFLIVTVCIFVLALLWIFHSGWPKISLLGSRSKAAAAAPSLPPLPQASIHALLGENRQPYKDSSGNLWAAAKYCSGGDNVTSPMQKIGGTEDPQIYTAGVRGLAHCVFPVKPGLYEIHLLSAELSDLESATRVAQISINAGPNITLDVVDQAGGDRIATSMSVPGVSPENDGAIHIDYVSEVSPLNGVEILPAPSARLLPIRIVAGSSPVVDSNGQLWQTDRYYSGGRRGLPPGGQSAGVFASNRVGRFRYSIPVRPVAKYQIKLYFKEPWFNASSAGATAIGSRIFNITCNGTFLAKNFDILAEGGDRGVVKTFENVESTPDGRIDLAFLPVVNYPLLSAIEITPEP